MVVSGVFIWKVSRDIKAFCGISASKSLLSEVCKDLDRAVKEFRTRPLVGCYSFLTVDANYFKVLENSRIISKASMIAYMTKGEGHREILNFRVYENVASATWPAFLLGLKSRGMAGLPMITSDAHEGILNAIGKILPTVS